MTVKSNKKLIEVALPLQAINEASAREKSIRHGHPSTLHLWWARRPLAAARAVIFAQMVDDPSALPELFPTVEAQEKERKRLFAIIERLVVWENTTNEEVLQEAREELWQSWRRCCADNADHLRAEEIFNSHILPAFHDPFAGGGALPLEAQRLGLEAWASDLNPVAVLINKAMIEIPPKFAGLAPVNPEAGKNKMLVDRSWKGAEGLAEDIRYYGQWMRDEAEKKIGHLYPSVKITKAMVKERPDLAPYEGESLTVIAWLWARTVKSPNPAYAEVEVPLVSSFMLSTRKGKEAWMEVVTSSDASDKTPYRFRVRARKPDNLQAVKGGTKTGRGANFKCIMSGTPIDDKYIKAESMAGRMGAKLMAIVAEGSQGRIYLSPTDKQEQTAAKAKPAWKPEQTMNRDTRDLVSGRGYGFFTWADLFTPRQLTALSTFSDLIQEIRKKVLTHAKKAWAESSGKGESKGNTKKKCNPQDYADALAVYLAFAVDKYSDYWSAVCSWHSSRELIRNTFGRQAIVMVWDYAECNPFSSSTGNAMAMVDWIWKVVERMPSRPLGIGAQADAHTQKLSTDKIISTDPPYYDNIYYADVSDFFYVWMRRALRDQFPRLLATLEVPKAQELVASPHRHGNREEAEGFFLRGMTQAIGNLWEQAHPAFPVTIYYAFKQSEQKGDEGTASTGWETFLEAVIRSGFAITGTWPIRTELSNRIIGTGTNVLASSIVLVCRRRDEEAPTATLREFINALQQELPEALRHMQRDNIPPVDLAQASIGPGMAIFSRYARVLRTDGSEVTVRQALIEINKVLDELLSEQEGDYDEATRWALTWFETYGFGEGKYGVAETLSKAKNTDVNVLATTGIIEAESGRVLLRRPEELSEDWKVSPKSRPVVWEMVHHLIRVHRTKGERGVAKLVAQLGDQAAKARELAYRLYLLCDRKQRAQEALLYNGLVTAWPAIMRLAKEMTPPETGDLFEDV
jgi:putative DNA methylase